MYQQRISTIQKLLQKDQALLVTGFYNIFYLTGFQGISAQEREAVVLICPERAYLFLPAMYEEQAKNIVTINQGSIELDIDHERDGLLLRCSKKLNPDIHTMFFEDNNLKVRELQQLQKNIPLDWQPTPVSLEEQRAIKNAAELTLLRKAALITDAAWNATVEFLKKTDYTKLTELDVADFMKKAAQKLGSEGEGFSTIVASGPHSSQPHHKTSRRRLRRDEPLLIDCGFYYQGYTADLTRTVFLGGDSQKFRNIYALVREANEKCSARAINSVSVGELCAVANDIFSKTSQLKNYLHGLGHGVGLEVHEQPFLRNNGERKLLPGMVITIEPGLYFPGKFGIRIEDLLLITPEKPEILSQNSSRELIIIP